MVKKYLPDAIALLGLASIVAGVSLISHAGALIIAGLGIIGLAILLDRTLNESHK